MTNRYPLITAFRFTGLSAAARSLPNGGFENWASGVPKGRSPPRPTDPT